MRHVNLVVLLFICIFVGGFTLGLVSFGKGKKEEGYASLFITIGLDLVVASFGTFFTKIVEMIILLKDSQNVKDSLKVSHELSKVNYVQLIVGFILITLGVLFLGYIKNRLYILNINGYFTNRIEDHYRKLRLSRFEFKEREIDFINENQYKMTAKRVRDILDIIKRKVKAFKDESRNYQKGYTGIAHIPFIAMAGTFMKRTEIDQYYEFDKKEKETFYPLKQDKKFPELINKIECEKFDQNTEDIVLAVSTTSSISKAQLTQFEGYGTIKFSVAEPNDNTIKSKIQLLEYRNKIIKVIEDLPKRLDKVKRVHLVFATQSCLPFEVGKAIEDFRNIKVIVYHFEAGGNKKYPWGIVINGKEKGKFVEG